MPREGGGCCGSAGGEPTEYVEARRASDASALAVLSSLFRDVLRLLQSGMVRTFLSEGEWRDVAGGVRPDSRTGVLLSAKDRSEGMVRLRGGDGSLAEEKRQRGQMNGDGE